MRSLKISSIIAAILCSFFCASCDSVIYEPEGDCSPVQRIRFKYDWNLKFADAFPAEVPSVCLYVFNDKGEVVRSVSETVTPERANDFYIELRDLPPANYDLLAWCGTEASEHFKVNHTDEQEPKFVHHTCRIERNEDEEGASHIHEDIGRLFHGSLSNVDMTQKEGTHEHTISLKKNTNVIRVVLQHMSGEPIDKDDFVFTLTEANGLMAADNELLPDNVITYHPWIQRSGSTSIGGDDTRADGTMSAVVVEFTIGRLIAGRQASLTVKSATDGHKIITAPVTDYALLVKGHYYEPGSHREMSDQEYLDRQDEYPMTFFLDENNKWINSVIYINAWRIVLNNPDNMH